MQTEIEYLVDEIEVWDGVWASHIVTYIYGDVVRDGEDYDGKQLYHVENILVGLTKCSWARWHGDYSPYSANTSDYKKLKELLLKHCENSDTIKQELVNKYQYAG